MIPQNTVRKFRKHVGRYFLSVIERDFQVTGDRGLESGVLYDGGDLLFQARGDYSETFRTFTSEEEIAEWLGKQAQTR